MSPPLLPLIWLENLAVGEKLINDCLDWDCRSRVCATHEVGACYFTMLKDNACKVMEIMRP